MASWSGVLALSGFQYHGADKVFTAVPLIHAAEFTSFWSTANAWGTFSQSAQAGRLRLRIAVMSGSLPLGSVEMKASVTGAASAKLGKQTLTCDVTRGKDRTRLILREAVEIAAGNELVVTA
jgi:hypothetical protein